MLLKYPKESLKAVDRLLSESSLLNFIETFWPWVEPAIPFVHGWAIEAICEHLEAVSRGEITRLVMNVPPGFMKSLTTNVFWPAYEWGPLNKPHTRYVTASYSQGLTIRDNTRFKQVIMSDLFREFWGERFSLVSESIEKVQNTKTGWKLATSVGGIGTGERGDRVLIDDPNSVKEAESDAVRNSTNQWFTEVIPSRVNDPMKSAIVVIQQRTHENDVTGVILEKEMDYVHLMIPMHFDTTRFFPNDVGWLDPRGLDDNGEQLSGAELDDREGELAWPERFPESVVVRDSKIMGPYATAGQFEQSPQPRGGGIFKREYWQPWPPRDWPDAQIARQKFPVMDYVVGSLDTAFTEKEENDPNALTIWGVWRAQGAGKSLPRVALDLQGNARLEDDRQPKIMLMYGWQKHLTLHGPPELDGDRYAGRYCEVCNALAGTIHHPTCVRYQEAKKAKWGVVEWTIDTCRRYKVDALLIEGKASGIDVANEMARLYANEDWGVQIIPARGDKVSRAYAVQHLFSNGIVHCPEDADGGHRKWCEQIITNMQQFPKGRYIDLTDSSVHALRHLREVGLAVRTEEADDQFEKTLLYKKRAGALYDA